MAEPADTPNITSSRFRNFCSTNPVQSLHLPISEHDLTRLDHQASDNQIPAPAATNEDASLRMGNMKCCCGRADCAYLEHNNAALGGLERDLETAARLGQALLDRHEAYVKDSQAEQARLSTYIAELEDEKCQLQDANHKMVVENRELLQKLEQLNTDFGESGKRVNELETLLQDCEQEIRRLNNLTRKTQDLELKMLDMEREQAELSKHYEDGKVETRSTIARWRESERKVRELEQEVKKIEWSARLDREKHEQIVARMERDRSLERELGLSEGRLKATAAVQNMQHGGPQKQVVSNFVRDILQDNASLQAGIAELRELLQSSNDEVQNLRDQVMLHQPVAEDDTISPQRHPSLSDELNYSQSLPKQGQQEVHVHHHYHAKLGSKKERTPVRKVSKRRALMPSALSSSPASSGTSTPLPRSQRFASTPNKPIVVNLPHGQNNRWSMQSTATASTYLSSMASSPRSYFDHNTSIFDRIERDEESSRPTSPESYHLSSPLPFKHSRKQDDSALSVFDEEDSHTDHTSLDREQHADATPALELPVEGDDQQACDESLLDMELTPRPSTSFRPEALDRSRNDSNSLVPNAEPDPGPASTDAVLETRPPATGSTAVPEILAAPPQNENSYSTSLEYGQMPEIRPSIRRSNSHDSLLSISGMDIHLAQNSRSPTSALNLLGTSARGANKHYFAPTPASLRQPMSSSTQPLAAITEFTATSRHNMDSASPSVKALHGMRTTTGRDASPAGKSLIGSVGGWVSSKWGRAPTSMKSVTDLRSSASSVASRPSVTASHFATTPNIIKSSASSTLSSGTASSPTAPSKRSVSSNAVDIGKKPSIASDSSSSSSVFGSSFAGRPPGINQSGPIPGLAAAIAAKRTPILISPNVNAEILQESLAEI